MVAGIEKFREYFVAHKDQYAIIGGAACDLLFNAAGLDFRATKDTDILLFYLRHEMPNADKSTYFQYVKVFTSRHGWARISSDSLPVGT